MGYFEKLEELIVEHGFEFIVASIIFVSGYIVARMVRFLIKRALEGPRLVKRDNYDPTVVFFAEQVAYYGIIIVAGIAALQRIGVPEASFMAALGGIGLAIGLALQTDLSNLAAGLLILMFKPFKVGDWIQLEGSTEVVGSVERIGVFNTMIKNKEKRTLFVPNSKITKGTIINSSSATDRLYRFDIGIAYESNHHEAIHILKGIFEDSPYVLNKENLEIGITSFGDNAVIISAFPRVEISYGVTFNYWVMSEIKDRFDTANIGFPYPQRTLHHNYPKEGLAITLVRSDVDIPEESSCQETKGERA